MSPKRVIYNQFTNDYKLNIVDHLNKNYEWEPVLMVGHQPSTDIVAWKDSNNPHCIIQDSMDLRMGKFDYSRIGKPIPIDADIVSSLSDYELSFFGILTDSTGWNFGHDERKKYYFDILKFWNTVIHYTRPDMMVSFIQPHTPECYALYLLCKYHYKIDIIFLDPVSLLDNYYHLVGVSLEELYAPISRYYNSPKVIKNGPDSTQYLEKLRSDMPKMPGYILECRRLFDSGTSGFRFKEFFKIILLTLLNGYGFRTDNPWKKNRQPYYSIKAWTNNIQYFFFVERVRANNRKLKKIYDPLCIEVESSKKYLYFAASYQPEATTQTNAGVYENFFLALDILSEVIPDDWIIYYKENPSTFRSHPSNKGSLRRDKYYYAKLSEYKNVKMISADYSTFDLIDNAQIVSTVSGTVAWEAAVRGIPSMSFGSAWYLGCNSIFWIKTLDDARQAISKVLNGYKPDQIDIDRYAASIEKVAIKGLIHRNFQKEIEICENPEEQLIRTAEAIYKAYCNHYSVATEGH